MTDLVYSAQKAPLAGFRREDRAAAQALCAAIARQVGAAFGIPPREITARRRSAPIALARQSAMYVAHVVLGLSYAEIGRAFKRDRTTAAHACRRVEERRDDPDFDMALTLIENVVSPLRSREGRGAGA